MLPLFISLALHVASPDAAAPAREPQLATSGATVGLAFGAGKSLFFATSADGGTTFSAPVPVATVGILPLNRHRGPRIAMYGQTVILTAVAGQKLAEGPHAHGLPSDGDLLVWRSLDGGKTWRAGGRVNDVAGAATEGLHTLAADGKGRVFAAWLDKRGAKGTTLFGALSRDGGVTWGKNTEIYASAEGTICQCCHPSAVFAPDGSVQVMWRNVLDGARDMYLTRSTDGVRFTTAEKLGHGTWKLNACPMDGGGLAVVDGRVVTAWRRDGEIFLARPGEEEKSLGRGVDVKLGGKYAIWTSPQGVRFWAPGDAEPRVLAPKGAFPNVVALPGGGALAAWEAEGRLELQLVR